MNRNRQSAAKGRGLSREQLDTYERDGIVFPIPVLSPDEISRFRSALDSLNNNHLGGSFRRIDNLHLFFDWAYRLATNKTLVNAVASILGNDILIFATLVFRKPPRDNSYVSWHQDSAYSNLNLSPSVSAWIALADSNPESGCVRIIPGSHHLGALEHRNVQDDANLLKRGERIALEVDEADARDVVLRVGEVSLHQCNIIHGSNPNSLDEPRIGFIVRFVTSEFACPDGLRLMRVRGMADCHHADLAEPPQEIDQATAFANWQNFAGLSGS